MNAAPLSEILGLVILVWCFWLILSPIMPKGGGGHVPVGGGCLSRLLLGVFTIILLPLAWKMVSLVAMAYHRTFVVSTEFASGVHDWPSYRTSSFKYLGAASAFAGYNALLLSLMGCAVLVLSLGSGQPAAPPEVWAAEAGLFGVSVVLYMFTRFFLRRMP